MNGYGVCDTCKNVLNLLYTRLLWKNARLVRRPILVRNRRNITMGRGFTCGVNCRINPGPEGIICIGQNFTMGDQCQIEAMKKVIIGNDVLIASKVYIGDSSHGKYSGENQTSPDVLPNERVICAEPIVIGDRVWVGNNVTILPGVTIGNGTVIGAGSIVTHSIPEAVVAVGNPAKVIKQWDGIEWKCIKNEGLS